HFFRETPGEMLGNLDAGRTGLEGDVEMVRTGQSASRLHLSENPADYGTQRFLHDFIVGNQTVRSLVAHAASGSADRPLVKRLALNANPRLANGAREIAKWRSMRPHPMTRTTSLRGSCAASCRARRCSRTIMSLPFTTSIPSLRFTSS